MHVIPSKQTGSIVERTMMAKSQTTEVASAHDYLFQREGVPPIGDIIPCALQHVLASFAGIITPAILIAATFDFTTQQRTDII